MSVRLLCGAVFGGCGAMLLVNQAPAAAFAQPPQARSAAVDLLPAISLAEPQAAPSAASDSYELTLRWPDDGRLAERLVEAGIADAEANAAEARLREHFDGTVPHGADVKLEVALDGAATHRLLGLRVISELGDLRFANAGAGLVAVGIRDGLARHDVRLDGRAYWTLRGLGAGGGEATALLAKVGDGPAELTVVVASRPDRFGAGKRKSLVYAASGTGAQRVEWVREAGSGETWRPLRGGTSAHALMQPTAGRLSSRFGLRVHPILGYMRFHRGVDYAAAWGTPVRAAADGVVAGAAWRGGYGRQVRIAHRGAVTTSYSHLSEMSVAPGERVRRGQLIGMVGASGLATGPHLHFEVLRGPHAIDPLHAAPLSASDAVDSSLAALVERYRRAARA